MKIKSIFQLMGFKSSPRHYNYKVAEFRLKDETSVKYAQWDHPKESVKQITDEDVDCYKALLKPGDFCIDIGAHSGDSTLPIAIAVGLTGFVLALEPNPYVYHVLEKNVRANRHLVNIETIMAAAVQNEDCFMQFEYSDSGFCNGGKHEGISALSHGHAYQLEVFGINLANELKNHYFDWLPKLRFIKIDTEGYDLFVIKSMINIIKECRPYIKTEIFKNTSSEYRKELFAIFHDNNYEIYKIDDEPVVLGSKLSLADINNWPHYDILCVPLFE